MWMICYLDPVENSYRLRPLRFGAGKFNEKLAMCTECRRVACVAADGSLYPCMQAGVYLDELGLKLGNVKESGLQALLSEGAYVDAACGTIGAFTFRRQCIFHRSCLCFRHEIGSPWP